MIVQLTGLLLKKNINEIIIDVNGIGYLCFVSDSTFNNLPNVNEQVKVFTHLQISENNHSLYAFHSESEKNLFQLLISVSGIGPKIGIQLLSNTNSVEFEKMIINDDVKMLSTLPGIGPKTAKRLIIELKDKFTILTSDSVPSDDFTNQYKDAYQALISLGYHSKIIDRVIRNIIAKNSDISTENLIKEALKDLR
tara:strand:- start:7127 stop:7711 length:585 start_codon:yes stop_codon:yes gene_type:complete